MTWSIKLFRSWPVLVVVALLAGCINMRVTLQPEDREVAAKYEESDCIPVVFGLAYGEATVEGAMGGGMGRGTITRARQVWQHDYQFLFFGARCIEVIGDRGQP
jgi:hypothetical protein